MIVHADDHERGTRGRLHQHRKARHTLGPEHRLVDNDDTGHEAPEQTDQVGDVGRRRERLEARFALEQAPQGCAHGPASRNDEHGDGRSMEREGLCGHPYKHRSPSASSHPGRWLNRRQ
jgi:hypothetical protein